jgi:hypothetical protein
MTKAKPKLHTVRYVSGVAAVFGSKEEALAQAAHDRCWPGHVDPLFIAEGDHSASHSGWKTLVSGLVAPEHEVTVAHGPEDMKEVVCNCALCSMHRDRDQMSDDEFSRAYQTVFGYGPDELVAPTLKPIAGGSVPSAGFAITSTAIALAAATAKSVIGNIAGSNVPPSWPEFAGSSDGSSGTLLIEVAHGTNATAGTSTSFTAVQTRGVTQTPTSTSAVTYTTEPTVLTITRRWRFTMPGGPWIIQFPLGREPNAVIAASTVGKYLGLRATASVAVTNSDWYLEFEE